MNLDAKTGRTKFQVSVFNFVHEKNATQFLVPEGQILFNALQFPIDFDDLTCIPARSVSFWSSAEIPRCVEEQWYPRLEPISRDDIPESRDEFCRVREYLYHDRRPDTTFYPISTCVVEDDEVQLVAFVEQHVVFRRLGAQVSLDLSSVPAGQPFALAVDWSPTHIEIRVTWVEGSGLEEYYSGNGVPIEEYSNYQHPGVGEVFRLSDRKELSALVVPASVARKVWQQLDSEPEDAAGANKVISPRRVYSGVEDFRNTLIEVVNEIQRVVRRSRPHAFWDIDQPKKEADAGAALRMLFEAICAYKNIQVFQEDPSRSGNVDFVFDGISSDFDHLTAILEIKNAHSRRVEHGLCVQLPYYLRERHASFGFFGVLWYKGTKFDKPSDFSLKEMVARLEGKKTAAVDFVVGFDLSFSKSASTA